MPTPNIRTVGISNLLKCFGASGISERGVEREMLNSEQSDY